MPNHKIDDKTMVMDNLFVANFFYLLINTLDVEDVTVVRIKFDFIKYSTCKFGAFVFHFLIRHRGLSAFARKSTCRNVLLENFARLFGRGGKYFDLIVKNICMLSGLRSNVILLVVMSDAFLDLFIIGASELLPPTLLPRTFFVN